MSHLDIERLAELADGEPGSSEREHLAECAMCSSELASYQRLVAMAADERRSIAPPLTTWGNLRAALHASGIIVTPASSRRDGTSFGERIQRVAGGTAAALLLLAAGTIFGRFSVGLPAAQALALGTMHFASPGDSTGRSASDQMTAEEFTSTTVAMAALEKAQREYERAAQYLAVNDTTNIETSSDAYSARLAVLDDMAKASLRAIEQRPQDPIMNQVYLTTLGARNLTLTKLGTALPVGARLTRF